MSRYLFGFKCPHPSVFPQTDGAKNPLVSIINKKKLLLQKPIPKFYILKIKITFNFFFFLVSANIPYNDSLTKW